MDKEHLQHQRHSLAHLLAAAVMELWPDTKRTIGPAIDDGFYFDFEFSVPLSENDLPRIEEKMREILPTWDTFTRHELSPVEAKAEYVNNPYKQELIDEFAGEGQTLTFYKSGTYWDLCRGGHSEGISHVDPRSFKLTKIAGAYWRGNEKNAMLTRIYGVAFETKEELEAYLAMREEAEKRDHRKLGKELDLFVFSDTVGKGLPLWTERGAAIRRELERFIVDEELKRDYMHVYTPDIAKIDLYKKSGHYPYYKDSMYAPIVIDDEEFMLRPMTCPHHFELYLSRPRSYRELPMRIAELSKLYRYEQSGELSGLVRVRSFCLADAHIICTGPEQAAQEVQSALQLIADIAQVFGLKKGEDFWYRLSLGDRTDDTKYFKDDAAWDQAEAVLRDVLQKQDIRFSEAENEAAFYGPKIDVQMKDVRGKENTAFTVQYDFVMPKRFNLTYTDHDGAEKGCLVVHRSSIGAIERVVAFLIEHYAGDFPLWLAPEQIRILPVADRHISYAEELRRELKVEGMRIAVDSSAETVGKKIRNAEKDKVPLMLVLGDKEMESGNLTIRRRGVKDQAVMPKEEFMASVKEEIGRRG